MSSKVHCDCCNVDVLKSGFSHHKKTKKHLVEEAKKFGKYDFSSGQIMQLGGIVENPSIGAKTNKIVQPKKDIFTDISVNLDDVPTIENVFEETNLIHIKRLNANSSKKDIYTATLALLKDFMRDIQNKPSLIAQLEAVIQKMN